MRRMLSCVVVLAVTVQSMAAAGENVVARVAFGSCAHQDRPHPIWEAVRDAKPNLFLLIGDNIYGDTRDMAVLRAKYEQFAAVPGFAALRREVPVLGTWDDHDYGENDAGAEYPMKQQAQQIMLDFFGVSSDDPRRQREGVYHAQIFGPADKRVQIILLDTRYHRSPLISTDRPGRAPYAPNTDPDATMLGQEQWEWLEEQLRQPAEVRLLVSSIQVIAEDHGSEKWMNFPHERERLYRLIRATGAGGVIVLSGDRHFAELSQMDGGGYPLYDLTSSGLTQAATRWRLPGPNRHRVAAMSWGTNFGMIEIDWSRPDPLISLQIRDESGELRINEKVPLSVLRAKGEQ
jgi:alkaline phosphatase D